MDLSVNEKRVMEYLEEDPSRTVMVGDSYDVFGVTGSTLWGVMRYLYRMGLVERHLLLVPRPDGSIDGRKRNYVFCLPGYKPEYGDGMVKAVPV